MVGSQITFAKLCYEELARPKDRDGIGLYAEKRLHSVLKRWMYDDFSMHEKKVPQRDGKNSRFVADILTPDGEIIEIQTGGLYPLARKMQFYMDRTDLRVTLVHPLIARKWVCWIDPATGEQRSRRRSPQQDTLWTGIAALRPVAQHLSNTRLRVLLPMVELEEYRLLDGYGADRKRHSHRYELIPRSLVTCYELQGVQDYRAAIPQALSKRFTAKDFGHLTHLRGYDLYYAIAVCEALGLLVRVGKDGRSTLFEQQI